MQIGQLTITAPALGATGVSTADVIDSVAWMWMQAKMRGNLQVHDLSSMLLPALNEQQYILASAYVDGEIKPVAYLAWANMSAEAEARYLRSSATSFGPADWRSGDRMWITEWFTPFGHARQFRLAAGRLLTHRAARATYHKVGASGLRVLHLRGDTVTRLQAKQWWAERPLPEQHQN